MARQLWNNTAKELSGLKTYATYANAQKKALETIGDRDIPFLISVTADGRFFPVAIGPKAIENSMWFSMATAG